MHEYNNIEYFIINKLAFHFLVVEVGFGAACLEKVFVEILIDLTTGYTVVGGDPI